MASIPSPWDRNRTIEAERSRGGVWACVDYADQLTHVPNRPWPPAALVQKLYESRQARAFGDTAIRNLSEMLGYYSDLQSVNSEDVLTWNVFGTLAESEPDERTAYCNRLIRRLDPEAPENSYCSITLWRRIPHPDTNVSGGPELDFLVDGDRCNVLGEAKWLSGEAENQGRDRDTGEKGTKSQLELRDDFVRGLGERIYGKNRRLLVAMVTREPWHSKYGEKGVIWDELCSWPEHPFQSEVKKYLDWKESFVRLN